MSEETRPVQQPSIGRIVHYVLPAGNIRKGEHRPAIITQVWNPIKPDGNRADGNGMCNLTVFKGQGGDGGKSEDASFWAGCISYSETPEPNTWHWPEYVPAA